MDFAAVSVLIKKMKKYLLPLIFLIVFGLIFSFIVVKAQENEEKNEEKIEIKYKPLKRERNIPQFSERQLGPFKRLNDFIKEKIAEHPQANFFLLTPSSHATQQGVVDQNQNNVLTINSKGFKMNWVVATDTMVINALQLRFPSRVTPTPVTISDINIGTRVRVLGTWDGEKLNAKRIIYLEKKVALNQIEILIERLKRVLEKSGMNIDLTPLIEQLKNQNQ